MPLITAILVQLYQRISVFVKAEIRQLKCNALWVYRESPGQFKPNNNEEKI